MSFYLTLLGSSASSGLKLSRTLLLALAIECIVFHVVHEMVVSIVG